MKTRPRPQPFRFGSSSIGLQICVFCVICGSTLLWSQSMSRAKTEYRYEKLTWPEITDGVELGRVCTRPCGAVEQPGPPLPLDVDLVCPGGVAKGAGQEIPDKLLVLP